MAKSYTLRKLYDALKKDPLRTDRPFSEELSRVNRLLFHPFATNAERELAISSWLQRQQPCLFGRIAAAQDTLHYCILNDRDFQQNCDEQIAGMIQQERLAWKRRSVRPTPDFSVPAHGFVLAAISERLALAAPDEHLRAFASKLQELWGCDETHARSVHLHWETLYLQNPIDHNYVEFTFTVDFFAAQGDGRWWQDHRSPGGILFTANSVGHMRKFREWYGEMKEQSSWVLQTAMLTIAKAAQTPFGRATWLKDVPQNGHPVISDLVCPFNGYEMRPELKEKDWTRYGGYLHTDHSIRPEFFFVEDQPGLEVTASEYLQDFTYLYDQRSADFVRFVAGVPIAEERVTEILGSIESWYRIARPQRKRVLRSPHESSAKDGRKEVKALLLDLESWPLSAQELGSLMNNSA